MHAPDHTEHLPLDTERLSEALHPITRRLTALGHGAAARHALAAIQAGNSTTARALLERLPASYLDQLAPAAAELADLARLVASLEDRT